VRINHYVTRSRAEWIAKVARGRADTGTMRDPSEGDGNDGNVVDQTALCYCAALRAELSRRGVILET
jgi:hypothetical protein